MNNLFYKFISKSSLYAEYFLKVMTAVCVDKCYPSFLCPRYYMYYKNMNENNVYLNGHIKMFIYIDIII